MCSGCFHFLAVMNNAAINICIDICFHFLDIYLVVKLLDHMVTLCKYLKNFFPKWLDHFALPLAMNEGSNFSTSLTIIIFCLFEYSHTVGCQVVSHCGFGLHFCDSYSCWACLALPGHFHIIFGKESIHILCKFLIEPFVFLIPMHNFKITSLIGQMVDDYN